MQLLVKPAAMLASFEAQVGSIQHAMNMLKTMNKSHVYTILTMIGIFGSLIGVPAFLIYFNVYLNAIAAIVSFATCLILTVWYMYHTIYEVINARQKLLDDLYSRCHTEIHKKHMKFFIDYFGI